MLIRESALFENVYLPYITRQGGTRMKTTIFKKACFAVQLNVTGSSHLAVFREIANSLFPYCEISPNGIGVAAKSHIKLTS